MDAYVVVNFIRAYPDGVTAADIAAAFETDIDQVEAFLATLSNVMMFFQGGMYYKVLD